jgi:ubiquinone/menaquinone biosynthesis C-methylase UbiE
LKGLPFEDNTFDFVHLRRLLVEFTPEQWNEIVVKELIRVCKPDGKSMGPTYKRLVSFLLKIYFLFEFLFSIN